LVTAVRTAARMQAFMPGASPPLVNMPILFMIAPVHMIIFPSRNATSQ
jgi:hypothetical protein